MSQTPWLPAQKLTLPAGLRVVGWSRRLGTKVSQVLIPPTFPLELSDRKGKENDRGESASCR